MPGGHQDRREPPGGPPLSTPSPTPPSPTSPEQKPLLSIRTTVILTVGVVLGLVVGALTAIGGQHVALAVVVGLGAAGMSIAALHRLLDA